MENFLDKKIFFQTDFSEENIIDSSEKQKSYLVVTETGKHLKVSPTSYFLLKSFEDGISIREISRILNASEEKIVSSYESLIARITKIDKDETNRRAGFWFLWEVIPSKAVNYIARPFSYIFHPAAAFLSILLIFTGIFLNVQTGIFTALPAVRDPQSFWFGYLLFFLSVIFHEFGHAGASLRFGAKPSGIGFTLYLIFPALYSDVTSSWRLKSWQRVIVGLGGIYFHLIVASIYTLLGIALDNNAFKIATLMIFGNCILNLNPIFKFDGYWIFSDLLGVINLSQQPKQVFLYLYNRLRGNPQEALPWKTWISLAVGIYSILSVLMIVLFLVLYSSRLWFSITRYPSMFLQFWSKAFSESAIGVAEIHTFILLTLSQVILFYFLYNIVLKPIMNRFGVRK